MDYFAKYEGGSNLPHSLKSVYDNEKANGKKYIDNIEKIDDLVNGVGVDNAYNWKTTNQNVNNIINNDPDQLTDTTIEQLCAGKSIRDCSKIMRKSLFMAYYRAQFEQALQGLLPLINCRFIAKGNYVYSGNEIMYENVRKCADDASPADCTRECKNSDSPSETCENISTEEAKWREIFQTGKIDTDEDGNEIDTRSNWRTLFFDPKYVSYLKWKQALLLDPNGGAQRDDYDPVAYTNSGAPTGKNRYLKNNGIYAWQDYEHFNKMRFLDSWSVNDGPKSFDDSAPSGTWHDDDVEIAKITPKEDSSEQFDQRKGRQYSDRGCADVPIFFLFNMESSFIRQLKAWDNTAGDDFTDIKKAFQEIVGEESWSGSEADGKIKNDQLFHANDLFEDPDTNNVNNTAFFDDYAENHANPGFVYKSGQNGQNDQKMPTNFFSNLKLLAHLYGDGLIGLNAKTNPDEDLAPTDDISPSEHKDYYKIFRIGNFINLTDDMIHKELEEVNKHYLGTTSKDWDDQIPDYLKDQSPSTAVGGFVTQIDWSWIVKRYDYYTMDSMDELEQQMYYLETDENNVNCGKLYFYNPEGLTDYTKDLEGKHPFCSILKTRIGRITTFDDSAPSGTTSVDENQNAHFSGHSLHDNYNVDLHGVYWNNEKSLSTTNRGFNHSITGTCVFVMKGLVNAIRESSGLDTVPPEKFDAILNEEVIIE